MKAGNKGEKRVSVAGRSRLRFSLRLKLIGFGALLAILPWLLLGPILLSQGAKRVVATSQEPHVDADPKAISGTDAVSGENHSLASRAPRSIVFAMRNYVTWLLCAAAFIALVAAVVIATIMADRTTGTIKSLVEFAEALAGRQFDRQLHIDTTDELQLLGEALNTAAVTLSQSEESIKKEASIRNDLGRYMPADIADRMVERKQNIHSGGERRAVTVLFADVVAFTPLAERLSAEEVVHILNDLFTILTEVVFRHEGTLDKFVGDRVMAIWGAPSEQGGQATQALAAAEDMIRWLEVGNAGWQVKYGAKIELAIGVHTGEAIVGNIGSETRMQYTAIGEVVNVAARLESIARPQQILVSGQTKATAGEHFDYIDLGEKTLDGRQDPVHPIRSECVTVSDEFVGKTIADRFLLKRKIGEGGMGSVYEGEQLNLRRKVAIKVMHPRYASSNAARARFTREARVASALRHPNAVEIYDFGPFESTMFLAMKLLEGQSLRSIVDWNLPPLPVDRAIQITRQVADVLDGRAPLDIGSSRH